MLPPGCMSYEQQVVGRKAMTRRSITTVLGSLLVGLCLVLQSPVVHAENGCDPADAGTIDRCAAKTYMEEVTPNPGHPY